MELFRETLATTLMRKRAELAAIAATAAAVKKEKAGDMEADASESKPDASESKPDASSEAKGDRLDYFTSKTLKAMAEFEAERKKKSKKGS